MTGLQRVGFGLTLALVWAVGSGRTGEVRAQPPSVDIMVANLVETPDSLDIGVPHNLTHRAGYDNQPSFSADGTSMWFSSIDSTGQADVWRWDAEYDTTTRITDTPESEFSPRPMPGGGISVVRVESDGRQRIWAFDTDGTHPRLIRADVDSVGYYAWADRHTLALFIVGHPHSLRLVDLRERGEIRIASDIGRSIHRIPGAHGSVSYFARGDGTWVLMELVRPSLETRRLFAAPPGAQDCAWSPGGRVVMGAGDRIVARRLRGDRHWHRVFHAASAPITRVAISPAGNRIAWVVPDRPVR